MIVAYLSWHTGVLVGIVPCLAGGGILRLSLGDMYGAGRGAEEEEEGRLWEGLRWKQGDRSQHHVGRVGAEGEDTQFGLLWWYSVVLRGGERR